VNGYVIVMIITWRNELRCNVLLYQKGIRCYGEQFCAYKRLDSHVFVQDAYFQTYSLFSSLTSSFSTQNEVYSSYSFLTAALGRVSELRHVQAALYPSTHRLGGRVRRRAGLDVEAKSKILYPCRGSNPGRSVRRFAQPSLLILWAETTF
jgi:hypothetical protein